MKKYGYMRVSKSDGSQLFDLQLNAITSHGVSHENIFKDKISGATSKRVGLEKCLKKLKKNDVLYIWKLDRLGRSLSHLIKIVTSLNKRDIHFRSITDNIDTTTATGMLTFHIFGAFAEYERGLISERTREGLFAAKKRGAKLGRPKKHNNKEIMMYYKKTRNSRMTIEKYNLPRSTWYYIKNTCQDYGSM